MQDAHVLILTAGVLGIIFFVLTVRVIRFRVKTRVMLGDGAGLPDAPGLLTAVRGHGNFAEFVPMILILLACLAHEGANPTLFLVLCVTLVLARVLHPIGIRNAKPNLLRAAGAILTCLVVAAASIAVIVLAFFPPI